VPGLMRTNPPVHVIESRDMWSGPEHHPGGFHRQGATPSGPCEGGAEVF
jgi:hypothetical protein